jgi:hypothetical protein
VVRAARSPAPQLTSLQVQSDQHAALDRAHKRTEAMRNIFLLYMPPGNAEAMVHYRDTIEQRVPFVRLSRFLQRADIERLGNVFGKKPIAVWGSRNSPANRSKFDRMAVGDDLLIVEGENIRLLGKIAHKTVSAELSRELWRNLEGNTTEGWDLVYFIANPVEIDVPFVEFCKLLGYETNYQLRGFTSVAPAKLEAFYEQYDDLYSILMRVRQGLRIEHREIPASESLPPPELLEVEQEDIDAVVASDAVSDHVRMQWRLASLGLKAGQKVWVPAGDQGKLRKLYEFNEFEREFAAGIDLQKNYVENIDVVWKVEFRIDAAFEIENTTAIYSGLLRFADLTVLAPNSTYPMFIVAPAEKRGRVRDQLLRPAFRRLDLKDKVRFLPYEVVDDIDRFFAASSSGLSVGVISGKAEVLT